MSRRLRGSDGSFTRRKSFCRSGRNQRHNYSSWQIQVVLEILHAAEVYWKLAESQEVVLLDLIFKLCFIFQLDSVPMTKEKFKAAFCRILQQTQNWKIRNQHWTRAEPVGHVVRPLQSLHLCRMGSSVGAGTRVWRWDLTDLWQKVWHDVWQAGTSRNRVTVERGRGGDGKEGRKVQEELENGEWCYRKHREEEENEERVWEVSGGRGGRRGNWESDGGWGKKGREKREKEKRWTIM